MLHIQLPKKWKICTCNLGGSFAITCSGKTIPHSKVSNFSNTKGIDTTLVSNKAGGRYETNISGIKAFSKVELKKLAKNVISASSTNLFEKPRQSKTFRKFVERSKSCDATFFSEWFFSIDGLIC